MKRERERERTMKTATRRKYWVFIYCNKTGAFGSFVVVRELDWESE
jgi:hypothetical protein